MTTSKSNQGTSNRGFASMDEDKQREIASKGGRAAHAKGTAHEFDSEEAREAGHKGSQSRSHSASSSSSRTRSSSKSDRDDDNDSGNRGGSRSSSGRGGNASSHTRGESSEDHARAGRQSHKNS
ncbi:MAG: hypothetical protein IT524_04460 [Nitrosomonas sp.]|uniref:KGG domain-containing protein n=1 Tax=Nitrosomonas sp. JL21 TaxID=153949 RepID=UPI00195FCEBA|nr:KGG domain-containing protein [Nitrosomonas sp. JL21]MCC7091204.1 hypothetical protein [Nitrosomonas sp.]